ncbi:outer membrane protein assembly factor BamE [Herbaspirillum lusitanum]
MMSRYSSYKTSALGLLLVMAGLLAGCSSTKPEQKADATAPGGVKVTGNNGSLFGFLKPYRIDIQQGNFVSKEMVSQLKPGMTREQVRFVLGTPLLADMFHANRWDYDFRLAKGNGQIMASRVSVFFKENLLEHVEGGDDLPTEQEYLTLISNAKVGARPELSDTNIKPASPVAPSANEK